MATNEDCFVSLTAEQLQTEPRETFLALKIVTTFTRYSDTFKGRIQRLKIDNFDVLNRFFFLQYKLCKVRKTQLGAKNVPFLVTHDGRTIRYPDPIIKANDTIQLDIATSKITDHIKFDSG